MNISGNKNKFIKNIDNIFNKFIIIYPFFLMIDTQFVLNALNILLFLLVVIKIKKEGFKKSFLEKWIILFLMGIIISLIKSPYEVDSALVSLKRMLRWIFFPLLVGQFYIKEKTKRYLLYSVGGGLVIYMIRFYLEISKKIDFKINFGVRYAGGYVIAQISFILGICLVTGLILLIYKKHTKKEKILLVLSNLISLILLILTQTRGMYLAVLLVIPLVLFIKNKKHFFMISAAGILIGSILIITIPNNKYVLRVKYITRLDSSNLGRIEVWKEAYRIFKENPINGVGYNNFSKAQRDGIYKYNKSYYHPHNTILKFLSETGIVGILGYLLLNGVVLVRAIKEGKKDFEYLVIFGIFTTLVFYENIDMIIWRNFAYPCIYFALGVLLNKEYKKVKIQFCDKKIKLG